MIARRQNSANADVHVCVQVSFVDPPSETRALTECRRGLRQPYERIVPEIVAGLSRIATPKAALVILRRPYGNNKAPPRVETCPINRFGCTVQRSLCRHRAAGSRA